MSATKVVSGIKRFFLSRTTAIILILCILAAVFAGYIFPQRSLVSPAEMEKWQKANPLWAQLSGRLGLDHVYSTPWFIALVSFFLLSLVFSIVKQISTSMRNTFGPGASSGGKKLEASVTEEELSSAIKKSGYFKTAEDHDSTKFVKHPWGYWGNVLFHLGLVLVIASSLLVALTGQQGVLQLVEGEIHFPGGEWLWQQKGMLTGALRLPRALRLDNVTPEFWETGGLKQLLTSISLIDAYGNAERYTLSVNQSINSEGIRIYQKRVFGEAFFIEFVDNEGRRNGTILQIEQPSRLDNLVSMVFHVDGVPYQVTAGYFADAERKALNSANPLLELTLVDGRQRAAGSASLKEGESGILGPYQVKLVHVARWGEIICEKSSGMPGIFLGFFIIILGGSLAYFTPPREFIITKDEGGLSLFWKASRFRAFYIGEYEHIEDLFNLR